MLIIFLALIFPKWRKKDHNSYILIPNKLKHTWYAIWNVKDTDITHNIKCVGMMYMDFERNGTKYTKA